VIDSHYGTYLDPNVSLCTIESIPVPIAEIYDEEYEKQLREFRRRIYGINKLELPDKSVLSLLIEEIVHPFFIFQVI